jgi:hypothetical protein
VSDDVLSTPEILSRLASKCRELFPVAQVTMVDDTVTVTESGVTVTATMVPWPKVDPRLLCLQLRGSRGGFRQLGSWPFKWWQVARGIDIILARGREAIEFENTMRARTLAYTPQLHEMRARLRQHGRVYMRLTLSGEPLFFFVAVRKDLAEAAQLHETLSAATPHHITTTAVLRVGNLTTADMEVLGGALAPAPTS